MQSQVDFSQCTKEELLNSNSNLRREVPLKSNSALGLRQ